MARKKDPRLLLNTHHVALSTAHWVRLGRPSCASLTLHGHDLLVIPGGPRCFFWPKDTNRPTLVQYTHNTIPGGYEPLFEILGGRQVLRIPGCLMKPVDGYVTTKESIQCKHKKMCSAMTQIVCQASKKRLPKLS